MYMVSKRTRARSLSLPFLAPTDTSIHMHLLTDFAHGTLSSTACVGQEKEFLMRLTNRQWGEHCSSTSAPIYILFFSLPRFPLDAWREREREGEEAKISPPSSLSSTRHMRTQDERVEACERRERERERKKTDRRREKQRQRTDQSVHRTSIASSLTTNTTTAYPFASIDLGKKKSRRIEQQ